MHNNQKRNIIIKAVIEFVFIIVSVVYLVKLNKLNTELAQIPNANPFKIIIFKNDKPLSFFAGAIGLIIVAVLLLWWFWRSLRNLQYTIWFNAKLYFGILFCVSLVVNCIIIVLILIFIRMPILWSVLIVGGAVIFLVLVNQSN